MANIIPDDTLEELRETANQKNMLTVQAYLLEHMDNKKNAEKKIANISIVRNNPLQTAGAFAPAVSLVCNPFDT